MDIHHIQWSFDDVAIEAFQNAWNNESIVLFADRPNSIYSNQSSKLPNDIE